MKKLESVLFISCFYDFITFKAMLGYFFENIMNEGYSSQFRILDVHIDFINWN